MESKHIQAMLDMDAEECLQHYGVLGMHWGVRRFQPYSLIPRKSGEGGKEVGAAKKKSKISAKSVVSKATSKKKSRNQKSEEAKAEYVEKAKTARQRHEELDRIVKSGNAKLVYEHRSEMTNKQLEDAIDRINVETKVAALVRQQNPTTLDKVKQFAGKVDDVNSIARTGINSAKNLNEIKDLSKKAQKEVSDAVKRKESSEAMNEIISKGNRPEDIIRLQSKLTKEDLQTATQRMSSIDANTEKQMRAVERANDHTKKQIEYRDYLNERSNQLAKEKPENIRRALKELASGKETADEWESDFKPTKSTKRSNAYFESEVAKETGKSTKKKKGK